MNPGWMVLCDDVGEGLAALPDQVFQCVVTSPPYYGMRVYDGVPPRVWGGDPGHRHRWGRALPGLHPGQVEQSKYVRAIGAGAGQNADRGRLCRCGAWLGCLGREPTVELYVEHLVEVFRHVRRVMRRDAVLWLNIGDTYRYGGRGPEGLSGLEGGRACQREARRARSRGARHPEDQQRLGVPERLVLALREDGWRWRQTVVWEKPTALPKSVSGWRWRRCRVKVSGGWTAETHPSVSLAGASRGSVFGSHGGTKPGPGKVVWAPCPGCDRCRAHGGLRLARGSWRPTSSHEQLLMFSVGRRYFGDAEAVRQAVAGTAHPRGAGVNRKSVGGVEGVDRQNQSWSGAVSGLVEGRNLRSVWRIPSEPFGDAHFATFPTKLVEPCILSSTPAAGSCSRCGAPWAPVVEEGHENPGNRQTNGPRSLEQRGDRRGFERRLERVSRVVGHRATCGCGAPPRPALVLDPFGGSGTTALVAFAHGRSAVVVDRSLRYCLNGSQPSGRRRPRGGAR